jgi:hypothetical protein
LFIPDPDFLKSHRIPDPQHWYPSKSTSVTMLVWASGAWLEPAMAATSIFTRLPHSASEDSVNSSSNITQHTSQYNKYNKNHLITQHHNVIKKTGRALRTLVKIPWFRIRIHRIWIQPVAENGSNPDPDPYQDLLCQKLQKIYT